MLLLFLTLLTAKAATLTGTVYEKGTKKTLSETKVFILPHKLSTVTNANGEFQFVQVPEGEFTWVVNIAGFLKYEHLDDTKNPLTKIYVEKSSYKIYETTVTSKIKKRDDFTKSLTQEDFLGMPGAGYDPVKAVQNLSGVAQTQSAQVIIQGANPDDTKYMVNQHQIPLVFHFGGLSSVVMPNAVESVDYLSAGFGPEYGRAIGGLIGLNTRAPKKDRTHGLVYVDLLNSGAMVEGPINKNQSYLVSARRSYVGTVLTKVLKDKEEFNFTVAPTYTDLTAIYDNQLSDKAHLKIDLIGSQDELKFVLNKPVNNNPNLRGEFYQKTQFLRLIPHAIYDLDNKTQVDASVGVGPDHLLVKLNNQYLDIKTFNYSTRLELRKEFNEKVKFFAGYDSIISKNNVGVYLPQTFEAGGVSNPYGTGEKTLSQIKNNRGQHAIYVRNALRPSADSKLTISPNFRVDRFEPINENVLEPRLNARYALSESLMLKGATGLYYQAPLPQESDENYGNPNLAPPKAIHNTFGLSKDFRNNSSDGLVLNAAVFHKKLSDLVIRSTTNEKFNNSGSGQIKGFENSLKYHFHDYTFTLAYTFLKSTRQDPKTPTYSSQYDQTHNINFISSYEKGKWIFASRLRYVTGNPYTPIIGSYYDADYNAFVPKRGTIYSERLNDFFQMDLRVDRKFVFNEWLLFAYLDIQNLTNHKNEQQINYSYDYSQKQATTGLPILPTIGLRGEF